MNLWNFFTRFTMRRAEGANEEETDTDTADEDVTESDESAANKKLQFLGLPLYKLSYKRLPKKCIKFSFLSLNGATFLAGITAAIISIWMLADSKLMSRLIGQRLFVTILLFIGIFSSSVSFIGILAFVKRRRKFLVICLNMSEEVAYKSGCLRGAVFLLKSHIHTVALSALFISLVLAASLFFALGVQKRFRTYRSGGP